MDSLGLILHIACDGGYRTDRATDSLSFSEKKKHTVKLCLKIKDYVSLSRCSELVFKREGKKENDSEGMKSCHISSLCPPKFVCF